MLVLSIVDKNIVDLTLKMCEVEKMNSSVKFEITRKNRELTNYLIEEELQISIVNE